MPALKDLARDHPLLDTDFQFFCASHHHIFTVEDFLLHDLEKLSASAQQLKNSDKLLKGISQVKGIISGLRQDWKTGIELLEEATKGKDVLSTGFDGIDSLLSGGLREGHLTELVGPSSSGKTQVTVSAKLSKTTFHLSERTWIASSTLKSFQICLKIAANVAAHNGIVAYVDTGNSFSPKRVEQFVLSILRSAQIRNTVCHEVMRFISRYSVFDIFSLFEILHQLDNNLRSRERTNECRLRLLIIDSISSLITSILCTSNPQGHALMVSAGFLLKRIADQYNVAVLVTNHMVGGEGGVAKPALGESWKSVPHARLLLINDRAVSKRFIRVLKHPSAAAGRTQELEIAL